MEEGEAIMTLDLPDRAEQERREDCVILEALAAQVKTFGADEDGVNPRQLFAAALAHCWGEAEEWTGDAGTLPRS